MWKRFRLYSDFPVVFNAAGADVVTGQPAIRRLLVQSKPAGDQVASLKLVFETATLTARLVTDFADFDFVSVVSTASLQHIEVFAFAIEHEILMLMQGAIRKRIGYRKEFVHRYFTFSTRQEEVCMISLREKEPVAVLTKRFPFSSLAISP